MDLAAEIVGGPDGLGYEALMSFGGGQVISEDGKQVGSAKALETTRQKLDTSLTDGLVQKYRDPATAAKDGWTKHEVEYQLIILGALIMATGAKIKNHDIQHLRQLASAANYSETFQHRFVRYWLSRPRKETISRRLGQS